MYNEVTPKVELSGPTNFAPLIYEAMKICQRIQDVSLCLKNIINKNVKITVSHSCNYC